MKSISRFIEQQSITGVCGQKGEVELVVSALIPSFFGKAAVTEDEEEEEQTLHFLSSKSWTNEMTNIAGLLAAWTSLQVHSAVFV